MKRILFALTFVLMLTVCFVSEAFALNRPWTELNNGPHGDDHPWGGDGYTENPPPLNKYSGQESFTSGIFIIDVIFKYFILDSSGLIETDSFKNQIYQDQRFELQDYSTVKSEGTDK